MAVGARRCICHDVPVAAQYVALLRGINVGGNRKVPMADLRAVLTGLGYGDVRTYIQSGNAVFTTAERRSGLEEAIEAALEAYFGFPILVVVRSERQLRAVIDRAPSGFGSDPATYYSDAIFLKAPLTPDDVLAVAQLREGVDEIWPGTGVVYFQRLGAQRTKSKLNKIVSTPEYKLMTIRNWTTTTKLLALCD